MQGADKTMFSCEKFGEGNLPDFTMYGGDTTPWSILLLKQSGHSYPYTSLMGSTAKLTLIPYTVSRGLGAQAEGISPVLTLTGTVTSSPDGTGTVLFTPSKSDTIGLRGKYTYQVEIVKDNELRVEQGTVTIKQNINRA